MLNRIGSGISIKQTTPTEVQESTSAKEQTQVPVAPAEQVIAPNSAEMKSDLQMFGSFQQASLFKQLERAPMTSEQANKEIGLEVPLNQPLDRSEQARLSYLLPEMLSTGSGDDRVRIYRGEGDLVHVNVNGEEKWSGTEKEFRSLTIDTGDGDDVIENAVGGATILTGAGRDMVFNSASNVFIDTGDGSDYVGNEGSQNQIETGSGNDEISINGKNNTINAGDGDNRVYLDGQSNKVTTGDGKDYVRVEVGATNNRISTGGENDTVYNYGTNTEVDQGEGDPDDVAGFPELKW